MKVNEFLNVDGSEDKTEIKTDLLKWLSVVFDSYKSDYYFPWDNIDNWIKIYDEVSNSEYIKNVVKKIQEELIQNGGDVKSLFEKEFNVKF
jgi:hypothetical protein